MFTRLAGGSDRRLLAAAPLLMLAQMVLLPFYLRLFMGSELADIAEPGPFLEAFALLIVVPLALAWATEAWAARPPAGARVKSAVDLTPVALMALTLLVVVASQFPRVRDDIGHVAGVIPIYVAFLVIMAAVGWGAGRALRFDAPAARALVFTGATGNLLVVLPLALALGEEYALTAAVIVTQTLLGMVRTSGSSRASSRNARSSPHDVLIGRSRGARSESRIVWALVPQRRQKLAKCVTVADSVPTASRGIRCKSDQSALLRRLLEPLFIALETREVAGSKPPRPSSGGAAPAGLRRSRGRLRLDRRPDLAARKCPLGPDHLRRSLSSRAGSCSLWATTGRITRSRALSLIR